MNSSCSRGIASLLVCAAFVVGCSQSPTGPTGVGSNGGGTTPTPVQPPPPPAPPPPPPPPTTATLRVAVDAGCSGRESNVTVFVDGSSIGVTQPGAAISRTVSIGDHTISATGDGGTRWAPTTRTVPAAGFNLNLTCNSTPPPSSTATLRIQVDANCTGKAANVEISIDGVLAGTTQPGSTGISKVVDVGNHTIFAKASNGSTWPTFTVAVPAAGFLQNLTCR